MATVLTAGRRCSRRRLGVGGGAASVSMFTVAPRSGPAPPRSRTAPPSSGSSRPRHSSAATRRRRRGVGLPPPPLFFLYSPLSLPYRRRGHWERGKTPTWVGGGGLPALSLPPAFEPGRRKGQGEIPALPRLGLPGRPWRRRLSLSARLWSQGQGAGVKEAFPPPAPARFARGCARPLGVRAGWAARPRPAPRAGVVRPAARKGRLGALAGLVRIGMLTRGPHKAELEGKGMAVARRSWAERVRGLGRLD
jgi:hypothetical protein